MLPKTTPAKLPGTVQPQWVRCGKRTCKCARGDLHGPYPYRMWRDQRGGQHKQYVKAADVEAVRAACQARQDEEREARRILASGPQAVRWLDDKRIVWPKDPEDQIIMAGKLQQTMRGLVRLACGELGEPRHSMRAFQLLTPLDLRRLSSQGLRNSPGVSGAASGTDDSSCWEAWTLLKQTPPT